MPIIDINCDMGESYGVYKLGCDERMIEYISSANIACGFHGGDPLVMKETVEIALNNGVGIGAHPGFMDLLGFGRRPMDVERERLTQEILYQLGALEGIARSVGGRVSHVKPHGSLNNLAAVDRDLSLVIAQAIASFDESLIFIALEGSCMCEAGEEMGLTVAREAFADRAYHSNGQLVSRSLPGAVLNDVESIVERLLSMVENHEVRSIEGDMIPIEMDTICIHGDTPQAVEIAEKIKGAFSSNGIEMAPLSTFL